MAQHSVTILNDGPRNAVVHVAIVGSGLGDLSDEIIIDPATSFNPALPPVPGLTIDRLQYDLTGFDAWLEFDYLTTDTPIWTMTGDQYADVDLCTFAGLKDRSQPDGRGKLKLSTFGLGNGDRGTIIIKMRKD